MKHSKLIFVTVFILAMRLSAGLAWGAVGCDLNEPDKDVKRLFPGSTSYKTVTLEVRKVGGNQLLAKIEEKLRDKLHGLYETIDEPYTIYQIYANNRKIGYIHGVNQKGIYGGIQIFLALDLNQRIKAFYIQKMSGQYAEKLRDSQFGKQFVGLTLEDFEQFDFKSLKGTGRAAEIKNPAPEAGYDFKYILRGTKKNLILVNEFIAMSPEISSAK
ncbi:MAG TPA: hypothetical protein VF905_00645 [Nitrospirota bacterium]